jgi:hypothetical protein
VFLKSTVDDVLTVKVKPGTDELRLITATDWNILPNPVLFISWKFVDVFQSNCPFLINLKYLINVSPQVFTHPLLLMT